MENLLERKVVCHLCYRRVAAPEALDASQLALAPGAPSPSTPEENYTRIALPLCSNKTELSLEALVLVEHRGSLNHGQIDKHSFTRHGGPDGGT